MTTKIIPIGRSSKSHGLKGHFILYLYNDKDKESILQKKMSVYLFPINSKSKLLSEGEFHTLSSISVGNKVIVALEGINRIEDIEKLFPFEMRVDRKFFPHPKEENEFYCVDVVGAKVIDCKTKEYVGTISGFYSNGAQEIAVIHNEISNNDIELPFIDVFFANIDIANAVLEVNLPVFFEADKNE
ncbi:MAG: 16S rRNA processing protein RimM [Oligoflexia bacterium]|nr:16S rRNA processing protein RimM [Oligoflexia bacterium]